jgi:hypothetical protein
MSQLTDQLKKYLPAAGDDICDAFKKACQFELEVVRFLKTVFVDESTFTEEFRRAYCALDCDNAITTTTTSTSSTSSTTTTGTTTPGTTTSTTTPAICYVYSEYKSYIVICPDNHIIPVEVPYGYFTDQYLCDYATSAEISQKQAAVNQNAETRLHYLTVQAYSQC